MTRPDCKAAVRAKNRARNDHYADSHARRVRVLNINAVMGVVVCLIFAVLGFWSGPEAYPIQIVNLFTGVTFAFVPWLNRFGNLAAPLVFVFTAYTAVFLTCWEVGTGGGVQYYLLTTASLVVLQLGIERIGLAALLASIGVALVITLQFLVPRTTGLEAPWAITMSFVITTTSACAMIVVTVWFAMRDTDRAESVMEAEYQRSEALLANMLPASIADRLKDPDRDVIADRYEEASVLFADMVGFTERASTTAPCDLVKFLDRLYSAFDELVDKHGLEKIKVSGDSYMVVSGVPRPRPDHVHALADFALEMTAVAAKLEGSARTLGAAAGRLRDRHSGRGRGRITSILLRRVGRRRQRRGPDGIDRLGGTDSSARGRLRTPQGRVRAAGARPHRGQGQRRNAHLVSHRPQARRRRIQRPRCRRITHGPCVTEDPIRDQALVPDCGHDNLR